MKRKYSKLTIIAFALGFWGALIGLQRGGNLGRLAIPIGLAAICGGVVAIRLVHQSRGKSRGIGFARIGAALGIVAILLGLSHPVRNQRRQFIQAPQWRPPMSQAPQREPDLRSNPMPKESPADFTSNLPIIVLHGGGQYVSRNSPTLARMECFDAGTQRSSVHAKPDYEGMVSIHPRGNTSLHQPKQSFTLHTLDSQTNQIKVSLLGLPQEADWVLYAPYEDKTLLRDVLAFELARNMGRYAPRTKFVELFIHTSNRALSMNDYAGVYVLIEKIKRGKDRVNISKLEPQDHAESEISGGYIIKRDHDDRQQRRFYTDHGGPYFYVYPKAEEITSVQRKWLRDYFNSFEAALYGENFRDPKRGYAAYLDVDSFIDAHWLVEATKNVDGLRYSAFLTKERGGKLKLEPPWDWNRSFGNANYYGGWQVQGWYSSHLRTNEISWYRRLQEDPEFMERCKQRWANLRSDIFNPQKINARIDTLAAQLEEAQQRNFARWPILGQQITCNYYVGDSFKDEVRWLKNWIEQRIAWIDGHLGSPTNWRNGD